MANDPDRDPLEATGPLPPADPWVQNAETMLHGPATGPGEDPGATRLNRPIDATAVGGAPADPQHWVARANVNPQAPRSSMPQAWEEDPAREDDPYGGRSWFTPVILGVVGFVLLIAVGIGLFLIYENNHPKTAVPPAASPTVASAAPTTGPAPTSAAPTSVAPSTAEPTASGPAIAVIPTLRGVGRQDAADQLKALGFNVNVVQVDDPTVEAGTVSRTDPAEGTPVTVGSTITIFIAKQAGGASPSHSAGPTASASSH